MNENPLGALLSMIFLLIIYVLFYFSYANQSKIQAPVSDPKPQCECRHSK